MLFKLQVKNKVIEYEHQYKAQQAHPALVLCPICIPEKKGHKSKLISSSDIQVWYNITQLAKECKTKTERQQKLRSDVNWLVALKQKGVKQRFSVHHCKAIH